MNWGHGDTPIGSSAHVQTITLLPRLLEVALPPSIRPKSFISLYLSRISSTALKRGTNPKN